MSDARKIVDLPGRLRKAAHDHAEDDDHDREIIALLEDAAARIAELEAKVTDGDVWLDAETRTLKSAFARVAELEKKNAELRELLLLEIAEEAHDDA